MLHNLLYCFSCRSEILSGVEMRGVEGEVLAYRARDRDAEVAVDIYLANSHSSRLAEHFFGNALRTGHASAVGIDDFHKLLRNGGRAVKHDGEARQALADLFEYVETQLCLSFEFVCAVRRADCNSKRIHARFGDKFLHLVGIGECRVLCGYVYCDAGEGESTTDTVFAGHSLICENASVLAESYLFENSLLYGEIDVEKIEIERRRTSSAFFGDNGADGYVCVDFETDNSEGTLSRRFSMHPFVPESAEKLEERIKLILTMQAKGLEKRLAHTKSKTAVIGISGGLDSALALLVTRMAFKNIGKPLTDIIAVTMPGFGTSARTFENSKKLVELSGATLKTVPIGETVLKHFQDIGHDPACRDVTYENAQARMRTLVLMDIANQTGGLVVGTGDLSELALGWATYNGDHMSMYGVNASVPKTLVKHLVSVEADLIGGECGKVLKDIVETEISPELLPPDKDGKIAQKTEDLVGPYALHDFFLYYIVRWGFCTQKVLYLAKTAFEGVYT